MDPQNTTSPRSTNRPFTVGNVTNSWSSPVNNVTASFHTGAPADVTLPAADQLQLDNDGIEPIIKRSRACEACRHLKVRCIPDPESLDGACRRCVRGKRECIVTAPARRRPKRTDARVVELERQIEFLKASLEESRSSIEAGKGREYPQGSSDGVCTLPSAAHGSAASPGIQLGTKRDAQGDVISRPPSSSAGPRSGSSCQDEEEHLRSEFPIAPHPSQTPKPYGDMIAEGLVDLDSATTAFYHYINDLSPHLPIVVFPPTTTFDDLRTTKPLLFLAIICVSIGPYCPEKRDILLHKLTCYFADRVFVHTEKSLELVQALLVAAVWYHSPKNFEEVNFYQMCHYAIILACDLGMNRRVKVPNGKPNNANPTPLRKRDSTLGLDAAETRRAWLGCYFLAINVAMVYRRPPLLRWNVFVDESIDILEKSTDAFESDKYLIYIVKLAHISEDVGLGFSMDDPLAPADITNPRIQFALKAFEKRLEECQKSVSDGLRTPLVRFYELTLDVYMHEIGMHVNHNVDDFRPPFVSNVDTKAGEFDTSAHIEALTICLTSSQEALDVFTTIDINKMRHLPTYYVARTPYLAIVLIKLMNIVSAPHSRLGQIFKPDDLKVEHYLEKTAVYLNAAGQMQGGLIPARFAKPLEVLRLWVKGRREGKHLDGWLPNPMIQTQGERVLPIAPTRTKRMRSAPILGDTQYSYPPQTETSAGPVPGPQPQAMEYESLAATRLVDQSPGMQNPQHDEPFNRGYIADSNLPTPNSMHITGEAQVGRPSGYHNVNPSVQSRNTFIGPARQSLPGMTQPYPMPAHIDATPIHHSQANDFTLPAFSMSTQDACMAQVLTYNLDSEFMNGQNMAYWEDVFLDPWYVASPQKLYMRA